MKIAFVQYPWWDLLGIMYLSAVLKQAGHECKVFIGERNLIKSLKKFSPDLIGFSAVTGPHFWDLKVARKIKEVMDVPIVFGGPHATFFPEVIKEDCVDIVCRGEGEYAMLELANRMEAGKDIRKIKNLWVKADGKIYRNELRPLIENLDELPFPDREIYYKKYKFLRNYPMKVFLTGRGCPYECTFCFNHVMKKLYRNKGKYVRRRSVDNVIEEIKQVREKYPLQLIEFMDDTFILNPKWLEEFFEKYRKEIDIPYICYVRADLVNEKIVKGLKQSGCKFVYMGIETANEKIRKIVLHKNITNKQIENSVKLLKKYGIEIAASNILGLPGETLEDAFETLKLNVKLKVDWPWCSIFQPYPGTELAEYAKRKGYLVTNFNFNNFHYTFFDKSVLNQKNIHEMVNLQKLFFCLAKIPSFISIAKILVKLPLDKLYSLIFTVSFGYRWWRMSRLSLKNIIQRALHPVLPFKSYLS